MPTQDEIRAVLMADADELPPANVQTALAGAREEGRRRLLRRRALAWIGSIAVVCLGVVGALELRSGPRAPIVGNPEMDIGPVRVERWVPPEPGWIGVVEGIDPNMPSTDPARLLLVDAEEEDIRGSIVLGVSAEVARSEASGHLYVLSSEVTDQEIVSFLTAIETRTGTVVWARQLPEAWQRRLPFPSHRLGVTVDGGLLMGRRGHELHAWSTRDGSLQRVVDLSEECPDLGGASVSWAPQAALVTCGSRIVEVGLDDGHVETVALVVSSSGATPVDALPHIVVDAPRDRGVVLTTDGRVARITADLPAGGLSTTGEHLVPEGRSSLVAPTWTPDGQSVVVPLRGRGDCPACAGNAAANWLAVVDVDTLAVDVRTQLTPGVVAVAASSDLVVLTEPNSRDLRLLGLPRLEAKEAVQNVASNPTSLWWILQTGG